MSICQADKLHVQCTTQYAQLYQIFFQCCFHEWQFEGKSGKCIKGCPEKARSAASIKSYDCTERNGLIFVWFHADQLPPQWFPLIIDDIKQSPIAFDDTKQGKWVYQGRNEYHVTCHIQDIPENGAGSLGSFHKLRWQDFEDF